VAAFTALILAPSGRDASIAAKILEEVGLRPLICRNCDEFVARIGDDTGFAVVTEDAFLQGSIELLGRLIDSQEPWSDFPFIVLTRRVDTTQRNPKLTRLSEVLRNVTFLDRPFHPSTFISLAKTASRSRQRQFEARSRILELRQSDERLRLANDTLEARVAERTSELEAAMTKVIAEVEQRERTEELLRQ
jgi:hypothetical protein